MLACVLLGGIVPLPCAAAPPAPAKASQTAASAPALVEAFQKGPIALSAKVVRTHANGEQSALPLFQVPVLRFKDKLELSFAGEAFDQRVTSADWSLIVVFLPRTIAPTDQGVVDCILKRKDDRMLAPVISVPYDSIPMIFLIPDKHGRTKALKDLNDHLEAFRSLCAKISEISTERAAADKFLTDLDAIDKSLSPAQYDNALQGFLHAYGDEVSGDLQSFLASPSSNLDKCSFLTQEFRNTNILVPGSTSAAPTAAPVAMTPGGPAVSAYVSIFFDLAAIINNLWPGHQFQYLPAVARDFHDFSADLYYSDWIRTTGDTRGALMCCPGNWEDQQPPQFDVELPAGEALLGKQVLLKVQPRENSRSPFALFGHDWKLLLTGPKGESLPPLALTVSRNKQSFVATPGPILEALRQLDGSQIKARIVGRWGFTSIAQDPQTFPVGCDPLWQPSPEETAGFQIGKDCAFKLPGSWAGSVQRVRFRPAASGAQPLVATLKTGKDGSKEALFHPKGDPGPGTLEIISFGAGKPALTRPLTLVEPPPEVTGLEVRQAELSVLLRGQHLASVQAVEIAGGRYLPVAQDPPDAPTRIFRSASGTPLEGPVGKQLQVVVFTRSGRQPAPVPAVLLPARPRIGEVQFTPPEAKSSGLPLTASVLIASTSDPSQVSLLAAKGYRFPSDPTFRIAIRNAEDPSVIRTLLPAKIRLMGRNQKATFTLNPGDLLGGRAAGKLECQVQDERAGASDWIPLPATFLDLPNIGSIQEEAAGFLLKGQSLDQIESVSGSPQGPWERTSIAIEGGREVARLTTPLASHVCYLRLFGWTDLVLQVKVPESAPKAKAAPLPAPEHPAVAQKDEPATAPSQDAPAGDPDQPAAP